MHQGTESGESFDLNIGYQLFADDIISLAPSYHNLWHTLGWFAAKCAVALVKISTSMFNGELDYSFLQAGGESLPPVREFKYLKVVHK